MIMSSLYDIVVLSDILVVVLYVILYGTVIQHIVILYDMSHLPLYMTLFLPVFSDGATYRIYFYCFASSLLLWFFLSLC
jgi:hypothetical protein